MKISIFHSERDNIPAAAETSWEQLVESLANVTSSPCTLVTCVRSECPHKAIRAWSPASWPVGATRAKATVDSVCVLVVDLDHVPPVELEAHLERLSGLAYVLHSSHSDRPDDRCVRIIIRLSEPVIGSDFARFWQIAIHQLELPADPSTCDASRLYYLPSRPSDACGDVFDGSGFDYAENAGTSLRVMMSSPAPVRELAPAVIATFAGGPSEQAFATGAGLLGKAWPIKGRHQAQLALSGALTRAGWPVELVADFCSAVAEVQEPGNGSLEKRLSAARSSAEKLESGEAVSGWPTVAQHVGADVVHSTMQALGLAVVPDPAFAASMTLAVQHTSRLELRAALEHERDRLKKAKGLVSKLEAKLLTKVLKAEALTDHADEDREKALVQAAIVVVRAAPAGTMPELMCEFLLTPAGRLAGDVAQVVAIAIKRLATPSGDDDSDPNDLPDPENDEALRGQLELDVSGRTRGSGANIERIVRFANALRGKMRFNLITKQIEVGEGRFIEESPSGLPIGIKNWLGSHWQLGTSTTEVADQLLRVAQKWCAYDPVAEYLTTIIWDGVPRIGSVTERSWLTTYCNVPDTSYARKVGTRFLISACARALWPGCKVDTVLVLEGDQGLKKSTTLAILGGAWFTDTPMIMGDKDSRLLAAMRWIVELGELKSLLRDDEASKGFLSQKHDDFRPPYGRAPEQFLRRCVFAGSTNEHEYLQDATGNRRYWAVRTGRCNTEALARDRDQLWAEAVYRYSTAQLHPDQADPACPGERWWFLDDEQREADEVIAKRRTEDPWVQMILTWTGVQMRQLGAQPPRTQFTLPEIAEHALKIASTDMKRYNKQISQALHEAGFESLHGPEEDGQRRRVWARKGTVVATALTGDPVHDSTPVSVIGSN